MNGTLTAGADDVATEAAVCVGAGRFTLLIAPPV